MDNSDGCRSKSPYRTQSNFILKTGLKKRVLRYVCVCTIEAGEEDDSAKVTTSVAKADDMSLIPRSNVVEGK